MRKEAVVVFALCLSLVMVASCNGVPAFRLQDVPEGGLLVPSETFSHDSYDPARGDRFPRFTCDVLSVSTPFGSVNHAACAAHCIVMNKGYRGGRCRDGVCHCRR